VSLLLGFSRDACGVDAARSECVTAATGGAIVRGDLEQNVDRQCAAPFVRTETSLCTHVLVCRSFTS
jgi:hypothetical protein